MAVRYRANLTGPGETDIRLAEFALREGYNVGWSATGVIVGNGEAPITPAAMISAVMASGVLAGAAVGLALKYDDGRSGDAKVARYWPCVVNGIRPFPIDQSSAGCNIHLVDPVSYLAEQPIWGAYRNVSVAEVVGAVLSLATGGDGKPTTTPILPGLPAVKVVAEYRDALNKVPYVIVAGQRLGDWLADFLAMLGLRAELCGHDDGGTTLTLADGIPREEPVQMSVVAPADTDPPVSDDSILIRQHSAFPGAPLRGALLDDPTKGSARSLLKLGAVGAVLTDAEIDLDEAAGRVYRAAKGVVAGMLAMVATTRRASLRPGGVVRLSQSTHTLSDWQIPSISHELQGSVYKNQVTLIRGDVDWHPELPLARSPLYVSAVVDGGNGFDFQQPVPRDRLGRIKVKFPFTPTPVGVEGIEVGVADSNLDGRVTLDDFDNEEIKAFTDNASKWEAEKAKYEAGEYNDPFPNTEDDDLTEAQLKHRTELREKRENAISYGAFLKARELDRNDVDRDGVLSSRDALVSEALSEALRDDEERQRIQEQWDGRHETPVEEGSLVAEYGRLFGEVDDLPEDIVAARADAEELADRWPPRIPLPVIQPMAGGMHGFIVAHRHGDTCRVAVHSPLCAEIVGFQYREDRKINADVSTSVAGLVVEHNYDRAWTGLLFRRVEDMDERAQDRSPSGDGTAD